MSIKLAAWALAVSGCLALAGCGSSDSSSSSEGTGGNGTGGNATGGAPGTGGAHPTGGDAGTGGVTPGSGGQAGAGAAGPTGEGGVGGAAGAGVAGRVGGSGGRAGAGGHAQGGGGEGGSAGHGGAGQGGGAGGHGGAGQGGGAGHAGAGQGGGGGGGHAGTGTGGTAGMGPPAPGGRISGYGTVLFQANSKNQMVRLQTTMVVPLEPPPSGTLFLWPGLQPDGANFLPIDNGVLQPVLTWGASCAPGNQPRAYSTWWISGQYVNTNGSDPGYTGCKGGAVMPVGVGDTLTMDMALAGTVWTQTVTDQETGQKVTYSIDMLGQAQNLAYFVIEEYSSAPVSEVIFTDNVISYGSADTADCKLAMRGQTDYVSVPVASSDGRTCSIAEIILRAQGIN
jgi:hypothetical protein